MGNVCIVGLARDKGSTIVLRKSDHSDETYMGSERRLYFVMARLHLPHPFDFQVQREHNLNSFAPISIDDWLGSFKSDNRFNSYYISDCIDACCLTLYLLKTIHY